METGGGVSNSTTRCHKIKLDFSVYVFVCVQKCCSFLLWSAIVVVIIATVVTATVTILYLNQYPLPFISR